jgi:hypothetical protein
MASDRVNPAGVTAGHARGPPAPPGGPLFAPDRHQPVRPTKQASQGRVLGYVLNARTTRCVLMFREIDPCGKAMDDMHYDHERF